MAFYSASIGEWVIAIYICRRHVISVIYSFWKLYSRCLFHLWQGHEKICDNFRRLITFVTLGCLAASNWPPCHPRSDHHVRNPHRTDYYLIQAGREDRSQAVNPTTEQEDSLRIAFGNLLNILIDRHLKLLYFKVHNRPAPEWHTTQALPLRSEKEQVHIYINTFFICGQLEVDDMNMF